MLGVRSSHKKNKPLIEVDGKGNTADVIFSKCI